MSDLLHLSGWGLVCSAILEPYSTISIWLEPWYKIQISSALSEVRHYKFSFQLFLISNNCSVQMRRKGVGVDQIYDARALRVVVGDGDGKLHVAAVEGCYNLLSVVHRFTFALIRCMLNLHQLVVMS